MSFFPTTRHPNISAGRKFEATKLFCIGQDGVSINSAVKAVAACFVYEPAVLQVVAALGMLASLPKNDFFLLSSKARSMNWEVKWSTNASKVPNNPWQGPTSQK
jgi:hypothetical protein